VSLSTLIFESRTGALKGGFLLPVSVAFETA
jgi:hypothetical protein